MREFVCVCVCVCVCVSMCECVCVYARAQLPSWTRKIKRELSRTRNKKGGDGRAEGREGERE